VPGRIEARAHVGGELQKGLRGDVEIVQV
jgi:hypothetical protein